MYILQLALCGGVGCMKTIKFNTVCGYDVIKMAAWLKGLKLLLA